MTSYVKVGNTWKTSSSGSVTNHYVNVAGSWKQAVSGWVKVGSSWKQYMPVVNTNSGISSIKINSTTVTLTANVGTYNVASGTTSVTVAVVAADVAATISNAVTGTGTASGTKAVSYANNGTSANDVVVRITAPAGGSNFTDYTVHIVVAAPPSGGGGGGGTTESVLWVFCDSSGFVQSGGSNIISGLTAAQTCAVHQTSYGNPANWACGTSQPATPSCAPAGCTPTSGYYYSCTDKGCSTNFCLGALNADCSVTFFTCI